MRIVIAGASSGSGKTTIATGIMGALRKRGRRVAPFKAGPDYIDPTYHTEAVGAPSRNLDTWMLGPDAVRELFARATAGADIAVIEGVMGLYDGRTGLSAEGSTAELAKALASPVLLVLDVGGMARSAAAAVLGYQRFDPAVRLAGVIVNNAGSPQHASMVQEAVREATGLPVLGYLPRRADLRLPERHLGLIPTAERPLGDVLGKLIAQIEESIDLQAVEEIAACADEMPAPPAKLFPALAVKPRVRVAVAHDEAFSFYYQDNLDLLAAWGAEIVPFSPLREEKLPPDVDGIYLGGGFPEMYAADLSRNRPMRAAVRAAGWSGMPIYAECGGLMYLAGSIADLHEQRHEMVSLLPFDTRMASRLSLAYRIVIARQDSILLERGQEVRGHEFHRSELDGSIEPADAAYTLAAASLEGYAKNNLLASYVHLHFGADPRLAPRFVSACAEWSHT